MIKVLSSGFHKFLGPFNMLTVKGCSEAALFREWSIQVFDSLKFRKYISYADLLFLKNVSNMM